jgi:glycerol-3-phosphate O-acyltransferase
MDKNSTLKQQLERLQTEGALSPKAREILLDFYESYRAAAGSQFQEQLFATFLKLSVEQLRSPYPFAPYHQKIRSPFDYYRFGLNFLRPLIDFPHSKVHHHSRLNTIQEQLRAGENVILLANHQTEGDPQIISILLEPTHPKLAAQIIYVAGERVVTDPLAIPFSMGCDLLCIYSKRYIDHPPEEKEEKLHHNRHTLDQMRQLLQEGGKIIYVAPSGGRDRKNSQGVVEVAPFDPNSVEMFYLMAQKAQKPTHFYPLALSTYELLPPPDAIQRELGEVRRAHHSRVAIAFGKECHMEQFPGSDISDKKQRRILRTDAIWKQVCIEYRAIEKN